MGRARALLHDTASPRVLVGASTQPRRSSLSPRADGGTGNLKHDRPRSRVKTTSDFQPLSLSVPWTPLADDVGTKGSLRRGPGQTRPRLSGRPWTLLGLVASSPAGGTGRGETSAPRGRADPPPPPTPKKWVRDRRAAAVVPEDETREAQPGRTLRRERRPTAGEAVAPWAAGLGVGTAGRVRVPGKPRRPRPRRRHLRPGRPAAAPVGVPARRVSGQRQPLLSRDLITDGFAERAGARARKEFGAHGRNSGRPAC